MTWTGPTASRRSWTRSCSSCGPRACRRPGQAEVAAVRGQAVRDHRLGLEPARLRHPDAQPDRQQPELPHAADRGLRHHRRPGPPTRSTPPRSSDRAADVLPGPGPSASSRPSPRRRGHRGRPPTTVDVYNGGGTGGLAGRVSSALVKDGFQAGLIETPRAGHHRGALRHRSRRRAPSSLAVRRHRHGQHRGGGRARPGHAGRERQRARAPRLPPRARVPLPTTGAQGGAVIAKNGIPCVDWAVARTGGPGPVSLASWARSG